MDFFSQAKNLGILTEFTDGQGQRHVTDEAALKLIVEAFPARTARHANAASVRSSSGSPAARVHDEGSSPSAWSRSLTLPW